MALIQKYNKTPLFARTRQKKGKKEKGIFFRKKNNFEKKKVEKKFQFDLLKKVFKAKKNSFFLFPFFCLVLPKNSVLLYF